MPIALADIYQPIKEDMEGVEGVLSSIFRETIPDSIEEVGEFVLGSPGKRLRPALFILSARARSGNGEVEPDRQSLVSIASAFELIHIASLIHDDVIDNASMRHNRESINSRWGDDVSVVFGDYIYARAFDLIGQSGNSSLFSCIIGAISKMCEGELMQVWQRKRLDLSRDSYMQIIQKKTASMFAACCEAGTILARHNGAVRAGLRNYGLNFGMAFQIGDDCKDITSAESSLGKCPGQDMMVGEVTLPVMNLLELVGPAKRAELTNILKSRVTKAGVESIRETFLSSDALTKTKEVALHYIDRAKEELSVLGNSWYKESLGSLADYVIDKSF